MAGSFALDSEVADDGRFVRRESVFRRWVTGDGSSGFPAAAGRYHLYVSLACPWSHRAVIVRAVKGLEQAVGISYAAPFRDGRGWAFTGERFSEPATGLHGTYSDAVNDFQLLSEAYQQPTRLRRPGHGPGAVGHRDRQDGQQRVGRHHPHVRRRLRPPRAPSTSTCTRRPCGPTSTAQRLVYDNVNNGVYEAGFARSQAAYDDAFGELFAALDELEARLGARRYLLGDALTEADWRLFPTLVRFDAVYYSHFKCNQRRIVDYPNLWRYTRDLYAQPGIAATVAMEQIKRHYYTTHDFLNPSRIIPDGPALDFTA